MRLRKFSPNRIVSLREKIEGLRKRETLVLVNGQQIFRDQLIYLEKNIVFRYFFYAKFGRVMYLKLMLLWHLTSDQIRPFLIDLVNKFHWLKLLMVNPWFPELKECMPKWMELESNDVFVSSDLRKDQGRLSFFLALFRNPQYCASEPLFVRYKEFGIFFNQAYNFYFRSVAANPNAPLFPEYRSLFRCSDSSVKEAIVHNPNSSLFLALFKPFFKRSSEQTKIELARSVNAVLLDEYALLFCCGYWRVREAVAGNPGAPRFKEFAVLFSDARDEVRIAAAKNPCAPMLQEYEWVFRDSYWAVRRRAAGNPNAPVFKSYVRLFTDNDSAVREAVANNPNSSVYSALDWLRDPDGRKIWDIIKDPVSVNHSNFCVLFSDPCSYIRSYAAFNPNAVLVKGYSRLIWDENVDVRISVLRNPNSVVLREFVAFFSDGSADVRQELAKRGDIFHFSECAVLFRDPDVNVRAILAENLYATCRKEYALLFSDVDQEVLIAAANNPNAAVFKEYRKLFYQKSFNVLICAANNPNAPVFEDYGFLAGKKNRRILWAVQNNRNYIAGREVVHDRADFNEPPPAPWPTRYHYFHDDEDFDDEDFDDEDFDDEDFDDDEMLPSEL